MKSFAFAFALAVLAAIAVAAPTDMKYTMRAKTNSNTDVYTSLTKNKVFKVLTSVLNAAGLNETLKNRTDATVLAPTDAAFVKTLKDVGFKTVKVGDERIVNFTSQVLASETIKLGDLLLYHVLNESKTAEELNNMTNLVTLAGPQSQFPLSIENDTFTDVANITQAKLTGKSINATNGIIHEIDHVLLNKVVNTSRLAALAAKLEKENPPKEEPICFPASAIVHTADGQDITMADLAAGHAVKVSESSRFSPVFLFSHKQHQGLQDFVRVTAVTGHSITLSRNHYMYANGKLRAARAVKVGDTIRTVKGPATVKSVEMVKDFGLVAPHTMHGDIVVNGVVASTYTTVVHPRLAHLLLAPVRAVVRMGISKEPLGSALYDGAPRFSKMVPSGPDMF